MKNILKRFVVSFKCDWIQLFHKFNWHSFNLIKIKFGYDKMTEGLEFEFYLLGFGIFIRYNLPASDELFSEWIQDSKKAIEEVKEEIRNKK